MKQQRIGNRAEQEYKSNFRSDILSALGVDAPTDKAMELLIKSAERYAMLADKAYQRVGDLDTSNHLGAANVFTKSTTELLRILKLLGLVNPTAAKPKQLQDFFAKKGKKR